MPVTYHIKEIADWANANQGVVSIATFLLAIVLGWVSGIFDGLRRRPRFRIRLLQGPTFCCTYWTGAKLGDFDAHRSAFALYLHVANTGSAPSSIDAAHVGYHWHLKPFSLAWLRYRLGWFWLKEQTAAIEDFQAKIGENLKIYPFLFQKSIFSDNSSVTFLDIGRSTNGVVYFEQSDSWGGCFPSIHDGHVRVKVRLIDAFGGGHSKRFIIPSVSFEEAQKYNPSFGLTLAHLRGELPKEEVEMEDGGGM